MFRFRIRKRLHHLYSGMQEGPTLYRIIGLLACSGLVAASCWWANQSHAQDNTSPRPYRRAQSPGQPGQFAGFPLEGASDVARRRVLDQLQQAEAALQAGDRDEAIRIAVAADRMARTQGVTFRRGERSPGALLAQLLGQTSQPETKPAEMPVGGPESDQALRIQQLLLSADSDVKSGRYRKALEKARQAEQMAARHHVKFSVVDLRPEHIVSMVRRHDPQAAAAFAQTAPPQNQGIQQVAHQTPSPTDPGNAKTQAQQLIRQAKQHIEQGDYDTARRLALEAKRYDQLVTYGVFEDRPDHILSEIERRTQTKIFAGGLPATPASGNDPREALRNQAVELVRQAQAEFAAGNVDGAEQLAVQAMELKASYHVTDPRPELVLQDIRSYRTTKQLARGLDPNAMKRIEQVGGVSNRQPLTDAGRRTDPQKEKALALLAEARNALRNGQFDLAEQRAREAERYDVTYGILEDDPQRVLSDIQRMARPGSRPMTPVANSAQNQEREQARMLLGQARQALRAGDFDAARKMVLAADQMNVTYDLLDENRPDALLAEIERAAAIRPSMVADARTQQGVGQPVDLTNHSPEARPQAGIARTPGRRDDMVTPIGVSSVELFNQGIAALRRGDREAARYAFSAAASTGEQLDPRRQQQLQDYLAELNSPSGIRQVSNEQAAEVGSGSDLINLATERRDIRADQIRTHVMDAQYRAARMRDRQPEQAIELLKQTVQDVENSQIDEEQKARLIAGLKSSQSDIESYLDQKRPLIELEKRNAEVRDLIRRDRNRRVRIEQELADLNEQYNDLMEQRRFAEANHIAQQAMELAPEHPVAVAMKWQSHFALRKDFNDNLRENKADTWLRTMDDVELAAVHNLSDRHPLDFPDDWKDIVARRSGQPTDLREYSEEEIRIREALQKPVSLHFDEEPLAEVLRHIQESTLVNVVIDETGLLDSNVTASTPISINVDGIKLKSALNLILGPFDLSYTIEDEVLKITSRIRQQGEMTPIVYPVADLVVPIPVRAPVSQFRPGTGYGFNTPGQFNVDPMGGASGGYGQLADLLNGSPSGLPNVDSSDELSGGAEDYDFQGLMELITTTIEPESWDEFGGNASITRHNGTLSLVIRQTQRVHQEISDLLTQLRRLQDLQVTIEVRFITVSDQFFERIGIDFDFNVQDSIGGPFSDDNFNPITPFGFTDANAQNQGGQNQQGQGGQNQQGQQAGAAAGTDFFGPGPQLNTMGRDSWPGGTIVGLNPTDGTTFFGDLDIPFRQGSFGFSAPTFGGFDPQAGISFGMAILSDIEAFLFVNAAQGDRRANIMFAPKLTLFNGQIGTIVSALLRPFVVSLTPVATGFAVGFQPQIATIPDGVVLTVQAVVSADRRYVRLSVSPQFTNITDVFTFSFAGGVAAGGGFGGGFGGGQGGLGGGLGGGQGGLGGQQAGQTGNVATVTIQQPVVDLVTVSTVVSVPDGGTVLLGGVKRLREQRNMAGVPILNKVPYVSRLFNNSGVGRETNSLMLMVTPRIIINEEEEELLAIPGR